LEETCKIRSKIQTGTAALREWNRDDYELYNETWRNILLDTLKVAHPVKKISCLLRIEDLFALSQEPAIGRCPKSL
jgi:hypothetical protein